MGPFEVVHSFVLGGLAKIYITRVGAFGFVFDETGALGSAATPYKKAGSRKNAITLQERRIAFANFVAAGILGRHAGRTGRPLVGAYYAGLDAAFSFGLGGLMRPGRVYDDGLSISDFGNDLCIIVKAGDDIDRIAGSKITKHFRRDKHGNCPKQVTACRTAQHTSPT
jgi:hypothetical protein